MERIDSSVLCRRCGEWKSRSNISRHQKACSGVSASGRAAAASAIRGRSLSADSGLSTVWATQQEGNPQAYDPDLPSTMLLAVMQEAVPALLDQHHIYDYAQLASYVEKYYPEIPSSMRAPVVVAATAAARHAALMHHVWEKNVDSHVEARRTFALEAASSLSFWALGLRQPHRSGNVYHPGSDATGGLSVVPPPPEFAGTAPLQQRQRTAQEVLDVVELPVQYETEDPEFNAMMAAIASGFHRSLPASVVPQLMQTGELSLGTTVVLDLEPAIATDGAGLATDAVPPSEQVSSSPPDAALAGEAELVTAADRAVVVMDTAPPVQHAVGSEMATVAREVDAATVLESSIPLPQDLQTFSSTAPAVIESETVAAGVAAEVSAILEGLIGTVMLSVARPASGEPEVRISGEDRRRAEEHHQTTALADCIEVHEVETPLLIHVDERAADLDSDLTSPTPAGGAEGARLTTGLNGCQVSHVLPRRAPVAF